MLVVKNTGGNSKTPVVIQKLQFGYLKTLFVLSFLITKTEFFDYPGQGDQKTPEVIKKLFLKRVFWLLLKVTQRPHFGN